jgi:hypothetical protein
MNICYTGASAHVCSTNVAAATPAILHITPILGILIGVVTALVLVAVIIVVVMRLRGRGDDDVKEHEDGSGNSGRRGTPPGGDKASSMPLSKDTDESIDSMDEKNPDVIPQNSGKLITVAL